jgi:hypothetical protein
LFASVIFHLLMPAPVVILKGLIMHPESVAAGVAALSVCESILLSLTENNIINAAEARGILEDAASVHHEAAVLADGAGDHHAEAAALLEAIIENGNSVRHTKR